jgi:hypothetical protein
MKTFVLAFTLVGTLIARSNEGLSFEDRFHEKLMEVGWKQCLHELDQYSENEQRYILERAVQAFGSDHIPRKPDRQENFEKAQSTLLAIPGHAKYYQDKIEALREEVLANSKKTEQELAKIQEEGKEYAGEWTYETYCENAFRTLARLPSPECVAVLGFYLNDPVGGDGRTLLGGKRRNPGDDASPRPTNSEGAAMAIRKLGIEHPPFPPYDDRNEWYVKVGEVDAWKTWWDEVKQGKRTYRFIGSNIEYGPDGPAGKEAIERARQSTKRDEERAAGRRKATPADDSVGQNTSSKSTFYIAAILAVCALVALAAWCLLRGRKIA